MYRIIVIGRGLIGSAAGRHLADLTDGVALLGPDEPADRAAHAGVFASQYDAARMTRVVAPDPAWAVTARRSSDRYADPEGRSGLRLEIGRASGRERVCPYGQMPGVALPLETQKSRR